MSDRNDIMNKVQGLLAKAEATTNEHEADAFYAKADEMLVKYKIDEAELESLTGKRDRGEVVSREYKVKGVYSKALIHIWNKVAEANDCKLVMNERPGKSTVVAVIIGYESDIDAVALLATSLQLTAMLQAKRARKLAGGDFYFQRSFIFGFANELGERFNRQKVDAEINRPTTPGVGLVLVSRRQEVDTKMAELFPRAKIRQNRRQRGSQQAHSQGRQAASNADIGNSRLAARGQIG